MAADLAPTVQCRIRDDQVAGTARLRTRQSVSHQRPAASPGGGTAMIPMQLLQKQVGQHPYPLLFATISGAHLYGFPSPDSDFDLRGIHVLPLRQVVGLKTGPETIEKSGVHDGIEIDLVTHDAKKFFGLLLKKNGYVLE